VLTKILGELHDRSGRVKLPGFYKGVEPVPLAIRRKWKSLNFPARRYLKDIGLSIPAGEKGYAVHEQLWSRPTAEINGIYAGYTGTGSKTVVPAEATAKLTFRLVGRQTPSAVRKGLRQFVKERLPADCKVRYKSQGGDSTAVTIAEASPWVRLAQDALTREWRREPVLMADGVSIPIVGSFKSLLKIDSLMVGFSLEDDSAHSPNEKYNLTSFRKGIRSWARIIAGLAEQLESETK
jgi:acetylornithine deacetylase/succinyl-diaminopimelate desuccinylase-like protein